MIHTLLNLTRPLVVLDTETTGVDPQKDRVVELGFQVWTSSGLKSEWRSLINPTVPIPENATRVHKITDAMMRGCRVCGGYQNTEGPFCTCEAFKPIPTFSQVAATLAKGFSHCDYAGQNVRFDLQITAAEMRRAGVAWDYVGARVVDCYQLERLAVPRSLSDLHRKYVGLPHDGAHGALSDVRAAATVIARQLEEHVSLPRTVDALHLLQWPGELDESGKFKMVDGVATCMFGKHRGKAMRDVPVDYYDWILKGEFPEDVKRLAAEAKLGKFPESGR